MRSSQQTNIASAPSPRTIQSPSSARSQASGGSSQGGPSTGAGSGVGATSGHGDRKWGTAKTAGVNSSTNNRGGMLNSNKSENGKSRASITAFLFGSGGGNNNNNNNSGSGGGGKNNSGKPK